MNFSQIDKEKFLNENWEIKPVVFKQAFPKIHESINQEDLIEMAQLEDFESRMISKNHDWSVEDGPFEKSKLDSKTNYQTLIVHNLNSFIPEMFELAKEFSFIPNFLFDDVMATLSNHESSVGAHLDNYSVFILQVEGKRTWYLEENAKDEFIEGVDVKLLKEFNPKTEILLEPGDLLYIPPHTAHHGVSIGRSLSLSIGFKSIELKPLVDKLAIQLLQNFDSSIFYKYPSHHMNGNKISKNKIEQIKEDIIQSITKENLIEKTIESFLSQNKNYIIEPTQDIDYKVFTENMTTSTFFKEPAFTLVEADDKKIIINDVPFEVSEEEKIFCSKLIWHSPFEKIPNQDIEKNTSIAYRLYKKQFIFVQTEEEYE